MEFVCEKYEHERLESLFTSAMRGGFIDRDEIEKCEICEWIPDKQGILITMLDGRCVTYNNILKTYGFGHDRAILEERNKPAYDDEQAFRSQFALRLCERLTLQEMTQEELAIETGLSVGAISKYVNAESRASFFSVFKIAKALDCSVEELMYGK